MLSCQRSRDSGPSLLRQETVWQTSLRRVNELMCVLSLCAPLPLSESGCPPRCDLPGVCRGVVAAPRHPRHAATVGRQQGPGALVTPRHLQSGQVHTVGREGEAGPQHPPLPGERDTSLVQVSSHVLQVGKRRCLGEELGRSLILLSLANIFQQFDVRLQHGLDVWADPVHGFTLSPRPFKVTMTRRQWKY